MPVSLDGAAPFGLDPRTPSFDLAQLGPSRGVPTRSLWDKPRASPDDFRKFEKRNQDALNKATAGMTDYESNLYKTLVFIAQREGESHPDVAERAAKTARGMVEVRRQGSPFAYQPPKVAERVMYDLANTGHDIAKGYISKPPRE